MGDFGDVTTATRLRDVVYKMARDAIDTVRPPDRYGRVLDVNRFTGQASVLLNGDTDPITVRMTTGVQPMFTDNNAGSGNGSMVLVGGAFGSYWIRDIISGQVQSVKPGLTHPRLVGGPFLQSQTANYDTVGPVALQAIGNTTHFGRWDNTNSFGGAGIAYLQIVLKWTFFTGNIKEYQIALRNNATAGVWQKLAPIVDSGDNNGNDMELEIMSDTNGFELRARRMNYFGGGFTPGGMSMDIWCHGDAYDYVAGSALGEEASTPPTRLFGTDASSFHKGPFVSPGLNLAIASQDVLSGGGDLRWDGTNVQWTQVIHISALGQNTYLPSGFIDIAGPTTGVAVPVYGKTATPTTRTTTVSGIGLSTGEALYVEPPWGDATVNTTTTSMLRVVGRGATDRYFQVPSHWILIGYIESIAGAARFVSMVKPSQGAVPFAMASGIFQIPVTNGAANSINNVINLPSGRFTQAPIITTQVVSGAGQAIKAYPLVISFSTSSFTVNFYANTTFTATGTISLHWHAIQMYSDAADG